MQPRLEKPITQQSLQGDLSLWGSLWYGMIRYAGEKDCKGNGKLRGLGSVIFGNETTKSCTPHQPAHLRFCSSSVKSPNRMKLRASGRRQLSQSLVRIRQPLPLPSSSSSPSLLTKLVSSPYFPLSPSFLVLFHALSLLLLSILPTCLVQPHVTSLSLFITCLAVDLRPSHPPSQHQTTYRCF